MYSNLKKRTWIPVLVLMLAALWAAGILCTPTVYAEETGSVHFNEAYASPGENLTVTYDGDAEGISYRWYMDDKQINCKGSKYCVTSDDLEKLIRVEAWKNQKKVAQCILLCSKLPVVYINTEDGADITSKDTYVTADFKIQGCDKYNSENTTLYDGKTQIRGRGNSSWKRFEKKPYKSWTKRPICSVWAKTSIGHCLPTTSMKAACGICWRPITESSLARLLWIRYGSTWC